MTVIVVMNSSYCDDLGDTVLDLNYYLNNEVFFKNLVKKSSIKVRKECVKNIQMQVA